VSGPSATAVSQTTGCGFAPQSRQARRRVAGLADVDEDRVREAEGDRPGNDVGEGDAASGRRARGRRRDVRIGGQPRTRFDDDERVGVERELEVLL